MSQLTHKLLVKLWLLPHRPPREKKGKLELLRNSENVQKRCRRMDLKASRGLVGSILRMRYGCKEHELMGKQAK